MLNSHCETLPIFAPEKCGIRARFHAQNISFRVESGEWRAELWSTVDIAPALALRTSARRTAKLLALSPYTTEKEGPTKTNRRDPTASAICFSY